MEHLDRRPLTIALPQLTLAGELAMSYTAHGLVLFVSPCHSPASEDLSAEESLAMALHREGFATARLDLLLADECRFADAASHLPLLSERLLGVLAHLHRQIELEAIPDLPIGLFASRDATPLAVRAAAQRDRDVRALVCHGGLVDLAGLQYLKALQAPLLMLAESGDAPTLDNARRAAQRIGGICRVEALDDESRSARDERITALTLAWFGCHLRRDPPG